MQFKNDGYSKLFDFIEVNKRLPLATRKKKVIYIIFSTYKENDLKVEI